MERGQRRTPAYRLGMAALAVSVLYAGPSAAAAAQLGLPHAARISMIELRKENGKHTYKVRLVRVVERKPDHLLMRREAARGWAAMELKALPGTTFLGVDFAATDLSGLDFSGSRFIGCDFSRARVGGAKLKGATYSRTTRWPEGFDPRPAGARLVE